MTAKPRPLPGLLRLLVTAGIALVVDLYTKHLSVQLLPPDESFALIPGYLHFTTVQNYGAVFGLGQGQRWLFVLVSIAAIGFVAYLYAKGLRKWWYDMTLGLLLAGILGNLYDRMTFGYVRDMIHVFPRWPNFFPWVFNVADSLLCVSIAILLLLGVLGTDERKPQQQSA